MIDLPIAEMSNAEKELEERLVEIGNRLLTPPSSVDELLSLLDQAETLLSRVEQLPSKSMLAALSPAMKGLIAKELLGHSDTDVKVAVASCISEIIIITAPEGPYDDDLMKEVFALIVETFRELDDISSRSYLKRVSILETVAKFRSCVVMLDLECDALILEMFHHFFKTIRDSHHGNIFSSMEMIMTVVLEESDGISSDLVSCMLMRVKKNNKGILPIARALAEKVIGNCASKLKPSLMEAIQYTGASSDEYSRIDSSACLGKSDDVLKQNNVKVSGECLAGESKMSERLVSDIMHQGSQKKELEFACPEVSAADDKLPRSLVSTDTTLTGNDSTFAEPSLPNKKTGHHVIAELSSPFDLLRQLFCDSSSTTKFEILDMSRCSEPHISFQVPDSDTTEVVSVVSEAPFQLVEPPRMDDVQGDVIDIQRPVSTLPLCVILFDDCHPQVSDFDFQWQCFNDRASSKRQLVLFLSATWLFAVRHLDIDRCSESPDLFPVACSIILRHFKTRGRVFPNQGRMMGIERQENAHILVYFKCIFYLVNCM